MYQCLGRSGLKDYNVRAIDSKEALPMIQNKHYAQRRPSISYAYGLFNKDDELIGVCTFGKPASNALSEEICGAEHKSRVYELNRLYIEDNIKNLASYFVSRCLKDLKKHKLIIVSYSDSGMGHSGYVYQATNFLYTGSTKERTDKYSPNNRHSRHYNEEYNHLRKVRTSKHRYVFFTDSKDKKNLKYEVQPYPKNKNSYYKPGERQKTKIINTRDDIVFYE